MAPAVYCKLEHMIDEVREQLGQPSLLTHVEQVAADWPGAKERMARIRGYFQELEAANE